MYDIDPDRERRDRGFSPVTLGINVGDDALQFLPRRLLSHSSMLKGLTGLAMMRTVYSTGAAPRGHMLSSLIGTGISTAIGVAAMANPIGGVLGTLFGVAVGAGGAMLEEPIEKAVYAVTHFSERARHLNFGDDFRDTQQAYTMRQVAARELGGSLLNGRRYLGLEGLLMHE